MGRRVRRQERELSRAGEDRRRARAAARDVYSAIGYEAMFPDGICEVEEGLFSMSLELPDISYQSAREETQRAMFSAYCQLWDYFGADSSAQLTIANSPLPADEIGARSFFREEGETAALAREYNRILNAKMREGVSNLVRRRWLTFSVASTSAEAAAPRLARMRNDAVQTLARIRCQARQLDGAERLAAISSQLRPGRRLAFDWGMVAPQTGLRTKDIVAPSSIDLKPGGSPALMRLDGTWCQVLTLRRFGSELGDRCIADVIDLPVPLTVSLHVQPMDRARAVAYVKQRIAWMDKEIIDEQVRAVKKGYDYDILPSELKYSKEEALDLLDHLQTKNQRLFLYAGLVAVFASSREELDDRVVQVVSTARRNSIDAEPLAYRQLQGLNSVLPLGHNHVGPTRMMTTAQVAVQMPFATQELFDEGGGYYGQNKQSSNLVLCDRKRLASPMGYVAGKPGSGKSFSVKREIENTILAHPGDQVVVFDPAGEYSPLVEANGGRVLRLAPGADTHLNPLDMSDVAHQPPAVQMAFKIDAVTALSSATMAEGSEGLTEADRSVIARCVEAAYAATAGATPTLGDLYNQLRAQPEREARDMALRYERYVSGAMSFFNHQSDAGFDRRVTCVEFKDLGGSMRTFGMLAALEAARNLMYRNFERGVTTWLYIDEVQSLFSHPAIISYFSRFWAEGRKFNLICTGITQNSVYMLGHQEARNLILNSDFILLHKQSPVDREAWAELLDLSEQEEGFIDESVEAGEGLLVAGAARIPIKDNFPRGRLYDLFNTKPDEVAELRRAARGEGR
ncbi:VirB4-like conjugal transfer ATPase, CD1110 family [Thermophilibacter provencensis]|uniref:VirB4-like conjugal transfer ATPase, CD1110 family n=1 Tax=Thermophilibacter provencensis TaxID=1852386 RepID=UPI000AB7F83F|nr:DUF87 domain-containing protein [Thermophilibacter provencensis]